MLQTLARPFWPDWQRLFARYRIEFHAAGRAVRLEGGQHMVLRDAEGVTVKVTSGSVWITQETDIKDSFVASGECFRIDRKGETLVAPVGCATLRVVQAPRAGLVRELVKLIDTG